MYLEFSQEAVFLLPEFEEHNKSISIVQSILIKRTEPLTIFTLLCLYLCNCDVISRSAFIHLIKTDTYCIIIIIFNY